MEKDNSKQKLVALLQLAYSGELAAAHAYHGHWRSVSDADERGRTAEIEQEELTIANSSATCCPNLERAQVGLAKFGRR